MDPRRLLPGLAAATCVVVVATLVVAGWRSWSPGRDADAPIREDDTSDVRVRSSGTGAAAVLAAWDTQRARAWADGSTAALRRLYVAGSRAGESDVLLLGRYARRGLRVTGLQTQVLDLDVLHHGPRRLHVVVTDRVVGGEAVGADRRVVLPRDRPSTRSIVLVRVAGRWLVDRVHDEPRGRGQPRAADSTSRTSRSSKS